MHYCVSINCVLFEPCETLLKVKIKYFVWRNVHVMLYIVYFWALLGQQLYFDFFG